MRALLVVYTEPTTPAHEDAYNRWYTEEHLPDVLAVPGYVRATRFVAVPGDCVVPQRYLSLYELEVEGISGLQATSDEHMRRIGTGEMRRSPDGAMDRNAMRALYYEAVGPRVGSGDAVPSSVLMVYSDPSSPDLEDEYNRWYHETHLPEVIDVPGFVAASRYRVTAVNMLNEPWVVSQRYLAVYELDRSDPEQIAASHAELSRRVREGDRMGMSPSLGAGPITRYYTRISDRIAAPRRA
jgi:hypothetical protein